MDELLEKLIVYAGEDYDENQRDYLLMLLEDAVEEIANIAYPWGFSSDEEEEKVKQKVTKKHKGRIRRIAEYHYDKTGKEGSVSWSENGVSSSYENAGTPSSYLRGIPVIAKIV